MKIVPMVLCFRGGDFSSPHGKSKAGCLMSCSERQAFFLWHVLPGGRAGRISLAIFFTLEGSNEGPPRGELQAQVVDRGGLPEHFSENSLMRPPQTIAEQPTGRSTR
jgi:hypothetical protein